MCMFISNTWKIKYWNVQHCWSYLQEAHELSCVWRNQRYSAELEQTKTPCWFWMPLFWMPFLKICMRTWLFSRVRHSVFSESFSFPSGLKWLTKAGDVKNSSHTWVLAMISEAQKRWRLWKCSYGWLFFVPWCHVLERKNNTNLHFIMVRNAVWDAEFRSWSLVMGV